MSATQVFEDGRCRTNLIYRAESGIRLERLDRKSSARPAVIALTPAELDGIVAAWPKWKEYLSSAGALNAAPSMRSPPSSKASPEPGNSRSSDRPKGGLL